MNDITTDKLFRHVEREANNLVQRVRVWVIHPSYDTKTGLRQAKTELDGMWRMAYSFDGHKRPTAGTPSGSAQSAYSLACQVVEHLDAIKVAYGDRPQRITQEEASEILVGAGVIQTAKDAS